MSAKILYAGVLPLCRVMAAHKLVWRQIAVMRAISEHKGCDYVKIVELTGYSENGIVGVLYRLGKKGFVYKLPAVTGGKQFERRARHFLTPKAVEIMTEIFRTAGAGQKTNTKEQTV